MPLRSRWMPTWSLALIMSLPNAGCSLESGLDLLAGAAADIGAAWCRHADNCYPPCDPEEVGRAQSERIDGPPESYCTP